MMASQKGEIRQKRKIHPLFFARLVQLECLYFLAAAVEGARVSVDWGVQALLFGLWFVWSSGGPWEGLV